MNEFWNVLLGGIGLLIFGVAIHSAYLHAFFEKPEPKKRYKNSLFIKLYKKKET